MQQDYLPLPFKEEEEKEKVVPPLAPAWQQEEGFIPLPISTTKPEPVVEEEEQKYLPLPFPLKTEEPQVEPEREYLPLPHTIEEIPEQKEESKHRTADDILSSPTDMDTIRTYMERRKGTQFKEADDREVYNSFINHMRFFSVNEVTTIGELRWLNNLEDEEKAIAGNAYQVFDSLGNFATNDGILGAVDGVWDYTRAALTSPSTYVGAGVGRAIVGSTTVAARQAAVSGAVRAAQREALKQGATREGARQAGQQVVTQAARSTALKQVGVAALVDAGANTFQDYMYQSARINSGAQDEYSWLQSGISATGGLVGGAVSAAPYLTRGWSGLDDAGRHISRAQNKAAVRAYQKAKPEMEKSVEVFKGQMADWADAVAKGGEVAGRDDAIRNKAFELLIDPSNEGSIPAAMIRAGVGLDRRENAAGVTHQMVSFARALPREQLDDLNDFMFKNVGLTYNEMTDILAHSASQAGTRMNWISQASSAIERAVAGRVHTDGNIAQLTPEAGSMVTRTADQEAAKDPEVVRYMMSLWRRSLVSHPATTAVNIQGWGQATIARSLAETLHGGVLGTAGLSAKLVQPFSRTAGEFGDESLRKSRQMFASQAFKFRTMFDPYTTREAALDILQTAPRSAKEQLETAFFGGVDTKTAAAFGLDATQGVVKWTERLSTQAARMSAVKLQDVYTKSFSTMAELDRLSRLRYNEGIEEMLATGRILDIEDDIWDKAVRAAMEDTFSADYTRGKSVLHLNKAAKWIEDLSNMPYVGFMFPFGRFMNNNMGFVFQYSPVAFAPITARISRNFREGGWKNIPDEDLMERTTKMIVGTGAIATLAMRDREKQEKGLKWNEEMDSTGTVINRENVAPGSVYLLLGRIANLGSRGEKIPREMWTELGDQLGPARALRDMTTLNPADEMAHYLFSIRDDEAGQKEFFDIVTEYATATLGDIGSGYTRPLEPFNVAVGAILGNDHQPDRRVMRGQDAVIGGALRYIDNIFAPFIGEEGEDGVRRIGQTQQSLVRHGPQREHNPIARLIGDREEQPKTDIDRLLSKVGLPEWTVQERTGIPEWDALVHEEITPMLDQRARMLMDSPTWEKANQRVRTFAVRQLLNQVKGEARDIVAYQSPNAYLRNEQRRIQSLPNSLRGMAKAELNIPQEDHELTLYQIEAIRQWVDDYRTHIRDIVQ